MKTGLESLDTGAPEITYSGNQGPKSPQKMQMAMADSLLEDEYKKYVFEMEEQGLEPMSIREFIEQALAEARQGVKDGGVMQLVKENEDGSRPGYRGIGGYQEGKSGPASSGGTTGSGTTGGGNGDDRREQYSVAQTQNIAPTTTGPVERDTGLETQRLKNIQLVEDFKNKPYEPPKFVPSIIANIALKAFPDFFANMNKKSRERFLASDINWANITDEDDLVSAYKSFTNPNIISEGGGDGPPIILPPVMPTTTGNTSIAPVETDTDTNTEDFVNRFGRPTSLPFADYRGGIEVPAADGGRIGYAGGGITDLRQGYFLGKLVKKATRGIKKLVKSPIGKAALAAAAIKFGPGLLAKDSKFAKFMLKDPSQGFQLSNLLGKNLTKGGAFAGITALSSLPLFMGQEKQEDKNLDAIIGQTARGPSVEDIFGMNLNQIAKGARENTLDPNVFNFLQSAADGGRIGYDMGGIAGLRSAALNEIYGINDDENEIKKLALGGSAGMPPITMVSEGVDTGSFPDDESTGMAQATPTATLPNQMPIRQPMMNPMMQRQMIAQRMNPMMARGMMQQPRIMAQEGGMMDMGGMEKDYRNEGGFVPIGGQERADDVPARLSKNEFVFTADAVRNAGGGDIDKGAEIMENMMENLEAGGKVSEASQGLKGAREMFATQQRLGEVL